MQQQALKGTIRKTRAGAAAMAGSFWTEIRGILAGACCAHNPELNTTFIQYLPIGCRWFRNQKYSRKFFYFLKSGSTMLNNVV